MPFSRDTKMRMFVRCGRFCCLCLKQCGINIEAAHIIDEAAGGPNDEDNGIPVCFDCHQEIGSYNLDHPRGNKFNHDELRARRDRVYQLVETGAIYALLVAARARAGGVQPMLPEVVPPPNPSRESQELLDRILAGDSEASRGGKLKLLDSASRAFVLDRLVHEAQRPPIASSLIQITNSKLVTEEESNLIVERTLYRVTMFGNVFTKSVILQGLSQAVFANSPAEIRLAFFEDVIESINGDQFREVNELVPALANHLVAVPPELHRDFVLALLRQARSGAWQAAPAARGMLANLPQPMALAGISAMNIQYLHYHGHLEVTKDFVARYLQYANHELRPVLDDYTQISYREFLEKYVPGE